MGYRIGQGYDLHQLTEGRKLILGGVDIPFEKGLLGHSDADCLLHAIIDAMLGAAALGDIGRHFPDNDPAYKDASSLFLLEAAYKSVMKKGYEIVNIDSTIIAQQPKMAPYIESMPTNVAGALGIKTDQVSVKAKSNEKVDAVGKGEAMAAQAVVLLKEAD